MRTRSSRLPHFTIHSIIALTFLCGLLALAREPVATPASQITVPPAFKVELLRSAATNEGSWISMTFDEKGRLYLGRDDAGIARLTFGKAGITHERVDDTLRHCRGILFAHGALYVNATDSKGFYRLRDTNGDDKFDEVKLLKAFDYRSRYGHGQNQIVLGPDKAIYLVIGNDVSFPDGFDPNSPYRHPQNDHLLIEPRDADQDNRVGTIVRTDPDGKRWEILAGGFRNQVDMAFNAEGEMFTWDADMEWDVGLPWYRPTRLNHILSAGEYGWRWGSGKWPAYYADSLPSNMDTGLGSPTGILFGARGKFPGKYRRGIFMGEWQNGRILLATLEPKGSSYTASYEVFAEGAPMNVCDMEFGPDGALYFITGGRGSQSGLYRVSFQASIIREPAKTAAQLQHEADCARFRAVRRLLETFHVKTDPRGIDLAWPHLESTDPFLRYAARLAIERQEVALWKKRALAERRSTASIHALLALSRVGTKQDQPEIIAALHALPLARLDKDQLLAALRAYMLCFIRLGAPDGKQAAAIAERLASHYPHENSAVTMELAELLVYLAAPGIVDKALARMQTATSQEEQIHHAQILSRIKAGWSPAARRQFLEWCLKARAFKGGHLLPAALKNIRTDFIAQLGAGERESFAAILTELERPPVAPVTPAAPFQKQWALADFEKELGHPLAGRSFQSGKAAFAAAACVTCHRVGDEGGAVGPDLSAVGKRFDLRLLLESILEPSKVLDPKYRQTTFLLADGNDVSGRTVGVSGNNLVVETNPITQAQVTIARGAIKLSRVSEVSPMPSGLADSLAKEQLLDLLAYLRAGGNPRDPAFQ